MLHESVLGEEFFALLAAHDEQIARQVAAAGCPYCGGPLHVSNYARKPRGGLLAAAGEAFTLRHSLCCGREGCRKRALPPSLRFLGRRVYVEAVVLLASVAAQLASALKDARSLTGVPGRTLRRWGAWWRGAFPQSSTWTELRPRFTPPPPDERDLPRSLVARLADDLDRAGDAAQSALADVCLRAAGLLSPATTSSVPDAARFVRGLGPRLVIA
jgi:hypothetical protein